MPLSGRNRSDFRITRRHRVLSQPSLTKKVFKKCQSSNYLKQSTKVSYISSMNVMIILWSPLRRCTYWLPARSLAVIRINGSTLKRLNPSWRMYMASCLSRWQLELNCTPPCLKAGNLHPKNDSNNVCKCSLRNKANIGLRHCWDLHCGTWHIANGAAFVLVQRVTTTSYSSVGVNRQNKLLYVTPLPIINKNKMWEYFLLYFCVTGLRSYMYTLSHLPGAGRRPPPTAAPLSQS